MEGNERDLAAPSDMRADQLLNFFFCYGLLTIVNYEWTLIAICTRPLSWQGAQTQIELTSKRELQMKRT